LTEFHFLRVVFHMKTTLSISDATMRAVKREAARRGQTMSELVESALRQTLGQSKPAGKLPPMPAFSSGGSRVDVSDRNSLYDAMGR
jgi:siderophore synthetase component